LTDDDLKIRHVRLCQCGKPADHDSICKPGRSPAGLDPEREVERVPLDWEERRARKREEKFAGVQRELSAERRQHRSSADLLNLHREALEREVTISTVSAGSTERGRGGSDPAGPPTQQLLDDDPRWREHWAVIRSRLERVHDLLDEAEGLGTVASTGQMLGIEKDRLICHVSNRGLSNQAVVDKLGSDIAGSPRTVGRARALAGLDAHGHEKTDT